MQKKIMQRKITQKTKKTDEGLNDLIDRYEIYFVGTNEVKK